MQLFSPEVSEGDQIFAVQNRSIAIAVGNRRLPDGGVTSGSVCASKKLHLENV